MAPPFMMPTSELTNDPRAVRILAKTMYRELRQSGLAEQDVMSIAGELLGLVTADMRSRRDGTRNTLVPGVATDQTGPQVL
jgi:hypothetical protein